MDEHLLELPLQPSARLAILLVAAHLVAFVGLVCTPLNPLAFGFVIGVSLLWWLRRYALLADPQSICRVSHDETGYTLTTRSGQVRQMRLEPEVVLLPWLIVMNFKAPDGGLLSPVTSVPVMVDATDAKALRHARIFLRWGARQPKVGGTSIVSSAFSSK